jgi:secreted trypsin-like serine protease
MKKKSIVILMAAFIVWAAKAGIYRHDVSVEKYKALAAEPQFDCVGLLYWKEKRIGSCVLIGDRYVLSAAHCCVEVATKPDTFFQGTAQIVAYKPYAENLRDSSQYFLYFKGKKYQSRTVHIYPTYLNNDTKHNGDIALIELAEPVADVIPAVMCKTFDELHANMVGVGYGAHGKADEPENIDTSIEKLAGENVIDSICGYQVENRYVSMLCDFDHPANRECNKMGSSIPRPLEYTIAGGDSGGGAFRKTNNGWELIGICGGSGHAGVDVKILMTKGVGYYGQTMEWQRVSVFADWIQANEH